MSKIDWGWISRQLRDVRDKNKSVEEATVKLVQAYAKIIEDFELSEDESQEAFEYAQKLVRNHAVIVEKPDETWTDVVPGEYSIGDTVRVKADAYAGDGGKRHNGKRGRVAAVHQAKTVVIYDDAASSEESFFHEPYKLERLV